MSALRGGLAGDGLCTSILGLGTGKESCRFNLDGGLGLSAETGGYVECQSVSVTGTRGTDVGVNVVEEDRGDGGLIPDLEGGRDVVGESTGRRGGSLGERGGTWGGS